MSNSPDSARFKRHRRSLSPNIRTHRKEEIQDKGNLQIVSSSSTSQESKVKGTEEIKLRPAFREGYGLINAENAVSYMKIC